MAGKSEKTKENEQRKEDEVSDEESEAEDRTEEIAQITAAVTAAMASTYGKTISATSNHSPPFNKKETRLWFKSLESSFSLGNIKSPTTRSQHLYKLLTTTELQKLVSDVLDQEKIHNENTYELMKERLIGTFEMSRSERLEEFLNCDFAGDMKPSELYRGMQHSGRILKYSDEQIYDMWKTKMPLYIKGPLNFVASKTATNELLQSVDQLWTDNRRNKVSSAAVSSSSSKPKQNRAQSHPNKATQQQPRNSQAKYNPNGTWCFNHFKYRDEARKCLKSDCAFKCKQSGNGRQ